MIDKLLTVVHKIEQQDLDFEIQKSKLFEVAPWLPVFPVNCW
ncbi:MAG: hypothetical protein Q4C77_00925 [Eubacteriales bacterium]|nr:hypothetical protein [Eubacteriales bacterium]